jgi:hypothetical protein
VSRNYPYPPDEFDIAGADSPVGVHRAGRTVWGAVWPFLAVTVVAVILAVGIVAYISRDTGTTAGPDLSAQGTDTTTQSPTDSPTDPATDTPTVTPTDEATPSESPTGPDIAALAGKANLAAVVRIINDSGVAGEEGRGQEALAAWGFTKIVTEVGLPAGNQKPPSSVLYYEAGNQDTAAAIAAILGIPADRVLSTATVRGDAVISILAESAFTTTAPN